MLRASRAVILVCLFMAPVLGAADTPARAQSAAPRIEVANPIYDFGSVLSGIPVTHGFAIRNAGSAELRIVKVQTSCGCTVAESGNRDLKPGQSTEITVNFDTKHQSGHREREITVYSNDPSHPTTVLMLKGDIKVEAQAVPSAVDFEVLHKGTQASRQIKIEYLGSGSNFKVTKVENSNPDIKVKMVPRPDHKPGALVDVTLLGSMPAGTFDDNIELTTSSQPIEVHVFGRVVGDLVVDPAQLSFGIVHRGQSALRIVRLTNSGHQPVSVTAVTSTNQNVYTRVEPINAGREYKITAELRKGTADGQLRGQLMIKTDSSEQPTLTVPFYGIVGAFSGRS